MVYLKIWHRRKKVKITYYYFNLYSKVNNGRCYRYNKRIRALTRHSEHRKVYLAPRRNQKRWKNRLYYFGPLVDGWLFSYAESPSKSRNTPTKRHLIPVYEHPFASSTFPQSERIVIIYILTNLHFFVTAQILNICSYKETINALNFF